MNIYTNSTGTIVTPMEQKHIGGGFLVLRFLDACVYFLQRTNVPEEENFLLQWCLLLFFKKEEKRVFFKKAPHGATTDQQKAWYFQLRSN